MILRTWRLRAFLVVTLSVLFACDLPSADPADFSDQDLSGRDFSSLRIQGFDLSGKNLQNTIFRGSDVSRTNFTGADLQGASFELARLHGSNFTNADMRGANLNGACQLQNAIWLGALLDPKWEKIVALFDSGQIIEQDLQGYDLSYVCFEDIKWDKPNFNNANLESATLVFYASDLAFASFRDANLQSTNLSGADLTNADFTGAKFFQTILAGANLTGALISTDQLSNAILSDYTRLPNGCLVNEEKC